MKILAIGDIVGRPGRKIITDRMIEIRKEHSLDFVIANGENAAGGSGITPSILDQLYNDGIDVVTTGDHVYRRSELTPRLESDERVLRPLNYPDTAAGRGYTICEVKDLNIGVINLVGRTFMQATNCPFLSADRALKDIGKHTNTIIVDFHAEATSEKIAMGWYLNGRVSAVLGTHTHVPTADARILSEGTAYITDLGMTGPHESVIGRRIDRVLSRFVTGMPSPFDVATGDVRINGVILEINPTSGKAISIERMEVRSE